MKRRLFVFCLSVLAFHMLKAQDAFTLIPKPLLCEVSAEYFTYSHNHQLEYLGSDTFLNRSFKQWAAQEAEAKIVENKMVLTKLTLQWVGPKMWRKYLQKLLLNGNFEPGTEGYVIKIEKNSILVLAQTETGLFYGFQSLRQLFKQNHIPCGTIYDKPALAIRGWQDDISRGPIPTLQQLKKEIAILASYKLNTFTLYTENVFQYKAYPNIAPVNGITQQEIKELKAFAALYHVNLIANQQSFGHMEKFLSQTQLAYLGEAGHIFSPAQAGTYDVLGAFYKEQMAAYGGNILMINADETVGLGSGQTAAWVDSIGLENVYASHINKLYHLLAPLNAKPAMWADIIGDYPSIIPKLPLDIILIPWAYGPEEDFSNMIKPIAASGHPFWVAPGIGNWQNIYPNTMHASINIYNLIRDGVNQGACGVLNTSWDDGGFALFGNNYKGFIWGADLSWRTPDKDQKLLNSRWQRFEHAYDIQFWQMPLSACEESFASLHQVGGLKLLHNNTFFEPLFPMLPDLLDPNFENLNQQNLLKVLGLYKQTDSLLQYVSGNSEPGEYLKFSMRESMFSLHKNLFRIHYAQFLQGLYAKEKIMEELNTLILTLQNLKETFSYLYLRENREYFLKENLQKFDQLLLHLQTLPDYCHILPDENLSGKYRKFTLSAPLSNQPIYYTLDGTKPGPKGKLYSKPIKVKQDIVLQCAILNNGAPGIIHADSFIFHQAIGSVKKINIPWSKYNVSYSGGGIQGLADGRTGAKEYLRSGRWQGYEGSDLIIDLSFERSITMHSLEANFYQNYPSWVILPTEIQLFVSTDGINYAACGTISHTINPKSREIIRHPFVQKFPNLKATHLRLVCKYYGPLPKGHPGAGSASMMFADEIIIH